MVSAVNARNFVIDPQRVKCREKICPACRPPFLIPPVHAHPLNIYWRHSCGRINLRHVQQLDAGSPAAHSGRRTFGQETCLPLPGKTML